MSYVTTRDEPQTASALVAFRAPANLVAALDKAADNDMCSRDVARRALLDHLRQRRLLPEVHLIGIENSKAKQTVFGNAV